jgi:hypothetical protein
MECRGVVDCWPHRVYYFSVFRFYVIRRSSWRWFCGHRRKSKTDPEYFLYDSATCRANLFYIRPLIFDHQRIFMHASTPELRKKTEPNQSLQTTIRTVTECAPSRTFRASVDRV